MLVRYGERVLTYELNQRQRRFEQTGRKTVDSTALVRRYDSVFESDPPVVAGVLVVLEHEQPGMHLLRPFEEVHLVEAMPSAVP